MSKIIAEKICERCGKNNGKQKWYQSVWDMCHGHSLKVSELETIFKVDDNDCIMISDMSECKSKKITIGDLKKYLKI